MKPESMIDIDGVRYPVRELTRRLRGVLTDQPGWLGRKANQYAIRASSTGGHRLYAQVAGQWRDASLCDISPQKVRDLVAWAQSYQ